MQLYNNSKLEMDGEIIMFYIFHGMACSQSPLLWQDIVTYIVLFGEKE